MMRLFSFDTASQGRSFRMRFGLAGAAGVLALAAMFLQVLFLADHLGASAAKTFGNVPYDAQLGFLELCLGDDGDGPVPAGEDCPICANAAVMAFGEPDPALDPGLPHSVQTQAFTPCARARTVVLRVADEQPIRAPPVVLS